MIYSKNESCTCETVKKEKEMCAGFAAVTQTLKLQKF